jgi:hypothetical protein
MNRQDLASHLLQKASTDSAFRQVLLTNPRQAIAESTGLDLPPNVEVTILEESPTHLYFVLPPAGSEELSEADLGEVAGGVIEGGRGRILPYPLA